MRADGVSGELAMTRISLAISNRWTGLWTGSVDWIAGLDYWIQPNCQ